MRFSAGKTVDGIEASTCFLADQPYFYAVFLIITVQNAAGVSAAALADRAARSESAQVELPDRYPGVRCRRITRSGSIIARGSFFWERGAWSDERSCSFGVPLAVSPKNLQIPCHRDALRKDHRCDHRSFKFNIFAKRSEGRVQCIADSQGKLFAHSWIADFVFGHSLHLFQDDRS